jgi:hypothetical protein
MFSQFAKLFVFGSLALVALPAVSLATQTKDFARCFGDHHGSYLSLWSVTGSEGLAQVNIIVTTDADESEVPARIFQVEEITKDGAVLPLKAYSWALRQSIKAEAKSEYFGYLKVRALSSDGSVLYMNMQKIGGLSHSLVIDGTAELLNCPVSSVQD